MAALALAPLAAQADVVLEGEQHIGDSNSATFQPFDPVTRRDHFRNPTNFHLSTRTVITNVRLDGLIGTVVASKMRLLINGNVIATSFSGDTFTLNSSLTLAGNQFHTLAIDPGCIGASPGTNQECPAATGNDIGFTSITLLSTQATTSTNLARRHHIGRTTENNDYAGLYPDAPECSLPAPATCSLTITFTLGLTQRLTQLRFYRLRDVDNRAQTSARVLLDGTQIAVLDRNQDPFRINTNTVLLAGTHTLTISAGRDRNGLPDDISWDEVLLLYTFDASLLPSAFNVVDVGANAVSGRLQTKIAGTNFAVDLVALNAARNDVQPLFLGVVQVELLDASDDSGALSPTTSCRSSWTVAQNLGPVTFDFVGGRKTMSGIVHGEALRAARFRVTQTAAAVTGCSADAMALRPDHFGLAASSGPASAASYTPGFVPTHKAGRPFTVTATAQTAANLTTNAYNGQPTLAADSTLLGTNVGVASADNWTIGGGIATTDNARYSEAGAFVLKATDTQFTVIDINDTALTDRTVAGQINLGRFIPDHFSFTSVQAEFTPRCGVFTYAGQPFKFSPGMEPVGRITAQAFDGTTTENYDSDDGLYKLPANLPQSTYTVYDDPAIAGVPAVDLSALPADDNDVVELGDGVAEIRLTAGATGITLQRPALPAVPYLAEIAITPGALNEPDLVDFDPASPARFGDASAGNGIPFLGAGAPKEIRFGRLVVDNAHGSERLPLDVPLRAEYWTAQGFATSTGDGCSNVLATTNILVGPASPVSLVTSASAIVAPTPRGSVTLDAPNQTGYAGVTVDLSAALMPWLRGDWNANGNWNEDADDPFGRASFGLSRQNDRRIYQREVVGG